MKNAKYKFSVVIPIYNTEQYLEETVESVINQTFGFEKNIQIIFVNDGSKDNSKEICLRYKEKYPNNIIYVEQKNAGVSSARNNGMNYIEGEYVNFLDSDDKWDKEAFKEIYKFASSGISCIPAQIAPTTIISNKRKAIIKGIASLFSLLALIFICSSSHISTYNQFIQLNHLHLVIYY